MHCYDGMRQIHTALEELHQLRTKVKAARQRAGDGALGEALDALDRKAAALEGPPRPRGVPMLLMMMIGQEGEARSSLNRLSGELGAVMHVVQEADMTPTSQAVAAAEAAGKALTELLAAWKELQAKDLKAVNERLEQAQQPAIKLDADSSGERRPSRR
jgi:hypothetical protein